MINTLISNPLAIAIIGLTILLIILFIIVIYMNSKLNRFLVGVDSKNIIDSLTNMKEDSKTLKAFQKEMEEYLLSVEKRLRKSTQSIQTVRFNPFHGTGNGGNQSFATAFLNEEGDGVVMSSLYSREHVSVYAKPVKRFQSDHELSTEEREAVEKAKAGVK